MTKLELLNVFLNERLTAAADEIFRAVKDTIVEYQSEILRSKEENERLKRLLNIAVQRLLHHPEPHSIQAQEDVQPSEPQHCEQDWMASLAQEEPEPPPQIKEEPELSNIDKEEQRPACEFDTTGLSSPSYSDGVCGQVEHPQRSHFHPSQTNSESVSPHRAVSKDVKVELGGEENRTCQPSAISPSCATAYSNYRGAQCDNRGDAADVDRIQRKEKAPGCEAQLSKGPTHSGGKQSAHILRVKNAKASRPPQLPRPPHQAQSLQKWHCCRECGKCFSFACQLEVHMRWHTKEKPYGCAVCRKSFTTVSMLKRHHRIHTGEKPFRCSVCGKCFNQSAHLNTHFRLHTGERARWARAPHPSK